jgi:hypothetical protein
VDGKVAITAKVSDRSGTRKVEFYVDWGWQETVASAPYNFNRTGGTGGAIPWRPGSIAMLESAPLLPRVQPKVHSSGTRFVPTTGCAVPANDIECT